MKTIYRKFKEGDKVEIKLTKKVCRLMFPISFKDGFPAVIKNKRIGIITHISEEIDERLPYLIDNYYYPECALTTIKSL